MIDFALQPPELLLLVVRLSDHSIKTYTQLIGLTHGLRAALPPLVTELSLLPDRADSIVAMSGVSVRDFAAGFREQLDCPAVVPTADAFACLVGPCTSLRALEVGDLVGCGVPSDYSEEGVAPHPAWIVRSFARNAHELRSLTVQCSGKFVFGAVFVAHMLACLPALAELRIDAALCPAALRHCTAPLRVLRLDILKLETRDWLLGSPAAPPLPTLAELHVEDGEGTDDADCPLAARRGFWVSPSLWRFVNSATVPECEDATVRCLRVDDRSPVRIPFRLRCPALYTLDFRSMEPSPPVAVDPATAASLRVLRLSFLQPISGLRAWVAPFANLRMLCVYTCTVDQVRELCEEACSAPRLTVLLCRIGGLPSGRMQLRCKEGLVAVCLQGFMQMQIELESSRTLMRIHTDTERLQLSGAWPRLMWLSVGGRVAGSPAHGTTSVAGGGRRDTRAPLWQKASSVAVDTAAATSLPALRQLACETEPRDRPALAELRRVLELARPTLRDLSLFFPESFAGLDRVPELTALLSFAGQEMPGLLRLRLESLPVFLTIEVRLPALRRLVLVGSSRYIHGYRRAAVLPLAGCPSLEFIRMRKLKLPAPRNFLPLHVARDGRLRLVAEAFDTEGQEAWDAAASHPVPGSVLALRLSVSFAWIAWRRRALGVGRTLSLRPAKRL